MSRSKAIQYYIAARLLLAPLMVWTIVTLVFLLLRATPGDPADAILGNRAPEASKEALRESLGLNKPLRLQYLAYLGQLLSLNLGTSVTSQGQSVWEIITQHFPATAELTFYSMVVAMAIGVTIGILSASRPNTAIDVGGRLCAIIPYSLPIFWVGMLFQLIFAVQLRWFPLGTRFPINQTPPNGLTGIYTLDSLFSGNLGQFFHRSLLLNFTLFYLGSIIEWHF